MELRARRRFFLSLPRREEGKKKGGKGVGRSHLFSSTIFTNIKSGKDGGGRKAQNGRQIAGVSVRKGREHPKGLRGGGGEKRTDRSSPFLFGRRKKKEKRGRESSSPLFPLEGPKERGGGR